MVTRASFDHTGRGNPRAPQSTKEHQRAPGSPMGAQGAPGIPKALQGADTAARSPPQRLLSWLAGRNCSVSMSAGARARERGEGVEKICLERIGAVAPSPLRPECNGKHKQRQVVRVLSAYSPRTS